MGGMENLRIPPSPKMGGGEGGSRLGVRVPTACSILRDAKRATENDDREALAMHKRLLLGGAGGRCGIAIARYPVYIIATEGRDVT